MVLGVIATMRANTDALPAQRELFNALLRLRMRPELLTDGVNGRLWEVGATSVFYLLLLLLLVVVVVVGVVVCRVG